MCGIVGGIGIDRSDLTAALDAIDHRGPDARGTWYSGDDTASLGHVRLSIIDLDPRSNQPMVCPRTGNVLVFNGEIYNFQGIRRELEALGWEFRTRSDTEVILAAYGEWGAGCLGRFNGMFAFVIYEPALRRFFLARDRVGKKPLYYALRHQGLVFGSELKALLRACPDLSRELDPVALKEYLELGYIPGALSIYREIRKLKPAHYATWSVPDGTFDERVYWAPPCVVRADLDEAEAAEELEYLLRDAVRLRLVSDVPVGVFLSGGLDSGLVTAMAARENPGLVAYTAQFPMARYDESAVARRVADSLGIQHCLLPVDAADGGILERLARQFDEPFADSSLLPTYLISQAIRRHVKVALSGDGGDELFAGYDFYALTLREEQWRRVPRGVRMALGSLHALMPVGMRGKNFLRRLPYDGIEHFLFASRQQEQLTVSPLTAGLAATLRGLPADQHRRTILRDLAGTPSGSAMTLLQRMTLLDLFGYLPDDVLVKVDRASMYASLEVRAPLLDYRIVEFACSLPDHLRLNGDTRKYLLKRVARKYLPADFPYGQKLGFNIPEAEWFRGRWAGLLDSGTSRLLDSGAVETICRAHAATGRYGRHLFRILMLQLFEAAYGKG